MADPSEYRTILKIMGILLMSLGLSFLFMDGGGVGLGVVFVFVLAGIPLVATGAVVAGLGWAPEHKRRKLIKNGKKVMADVKGISGATSVSFAERFYVKYSIICQLYDEMGEIHFYESCNFKLQPNQIVRLIKSAIGSRIPTKFFRVNTWSAPIPLEIYVGQIPVYFLGEKYYVDEKEFLKRVEVYKRVS